MYYFFSFIILKLAQKANYGKVRAVETCCEVTAANAISQRLYTPIASNLIASDFFHRLMRTLPAIFFADRGDVAVLKNHVIKSPNLMGWLYWRFAAINVENRNRCTEHTLRFSPIAAIGV